MQKSIIIKCTASNKQFSKRKWPSLSQIPTRVHLYCSRRLTQVHLHCSCSLLAVIIIFQKLTMENPLIMAPQLEGYPWPFKGSTCQAMRKNPTREAARFCRNTWTTLRVATTHTESSQTGYQQSTIFLLSLFIL